MSSSSCEELAFPWPAAPDWSAEVDRLAKEAGVSVLGAGVNPGFLMDLLPAALTAICRRVDKITVLRHQDASVRRLPFQQKIGAGLTVREFQAKLASGSLRHVGLTESMHLIAWRLGWRLDRTEDTLEPILSEQEAQGAGCTAAVDLLRFRHQGCRRKDQEAIRIGVPAVPQSAIRNPNSEIPIVAGVHQTGRGYVGGEERIVLDFRAGLGEPVEDSVIIEGEPPLRFTFPGGVNGDVATCAILTNAIPSVLAAPPGLRTMAHVPPVPLVRGRVGV